MLFSVHSRTSSQISGADGSNFSEPLLDFAPDEHFNYMTLGILPEDWPDNLMQCCDERGGRLRCPRSAPVMCANMECAITIDNCTEHGGQRECPEE